MNPIKRNYSIKDVLNARGPIKVEYTISNLGSSIMRTALKNQEQLFALGSLSGVQAIQSIDAGLNAIYVSGWQIASSKNINNHLYPDLGLYNSESTSNLVAEINNSMIKRGQITSLNSSEQIPINSILKPIIADIEAGFGGVLNVFEITKSLIKAGVAAIHIEDQLSSEKKCGHLGGKVVIPTKIFIDKLNAIRFASDVCDSNIIVIGRLDSLNANYITDKIDVLDTEFIDFDKERTYEGFYTIINQKEFLISRALRIAPFVDMIWFESDYPDIDFAIEFSKKIRDKFPKMLFAYNCSPSFNWSLLSKKELKEFNSKLYLNNFLFQFITLAGFHSMNLGMYELAENIKNNEMLGYQQLQLKEKDFYDSKNYKSFKHQEFVGTSYYDYLKDVISNNKSSTNSMNESTEIEQF